MLSEISLSTSKRNDTVDITNEVQKIVNKSKIKEGLCCVYAPHATCSILINENYDPNVMVDIQTLLEKTVPQGQWLHDKVDGNADSHIKVALVGGSQTIPVKDGKLTLGTWQSINVAEFDGPRTRKIIIKIIKG